MYSDHDDLCRVALLPRLCCTESRSQKRKRPTNKGYTGRGERERGSPASVRGCWALFLTPMGPAPRLADNFHLVKGNMRRGPVDPCLWLAEGATRPLQEHVQSGCARVWVSVSSTKQEDRHNRFTSLALAGGRRVRGERQGEAILSIVGVLINTQSHISFSHTNKTPTNSVQPFPTHLCGSLRHSCVAILIRRRRLAALNVSDAVRCHRSCTSKASQHRHFFCSDDYMFLILLLIHSLIPHPHPHTQEDGASIHARVQPWRLW